MPTLEVRHSHSMSPEETKQKVERWTKKIERRYGLSSKWASESRLDVSGKGVKAQVHLEDKVLAIRIELPLLMAVAKPAIEKMVADILKKEFV
jgi:putative polyhydroxyalkanoate system protein